MPTFAQPQLALASFSAPSFVERERSEASPPLTAVGAAVGSLGADVVGAVCSSLEAHHSALSLLLAAADRGAVVIPQGLRECLERAASTLPAALDRGIAPPLITAVA